MMIGDWTLIICSTFLSLEVGIGIGIGTGRVEMLC